ncbi:MAG: hypothetical protein Q7U40_03810 [Desulfatirhabdiaceae bacterium]|jgi:hypothetical protein|nr:hypothetical protein [Desulfatirhabdiaceae bacterium]
MHKQMCFVITTQIDQKTAHRSADLCLIKCLHELQDRQYNSRDNTTSSTDKSSSIATEFHFRPAAVPHFIVDYQFVTFNIQLFDDLALNLLSACIDP